MRAVFLPQSESRTLVHTTLDCRKLQRETFRFGFYVGGLIVLAGCLIVGIVLSGWQENIFDSQMRIVQEQHRAEIEYEKKRVARYAEIDALATAMDRARGE